MSVQYSASRHRFQQEIQAKRCHKRIRYCRDPRCSEECRARWARRETQILRFLCGSVTCHIYFGNVAVDAVLDTEQEKRIQARFKRALTRLHKSIKVHAVEEMGNDDRVHSHYCVMSDIPVSHAQVKRMWTEAAAPHQTTVDHDSAVTLDGACSYMHKAMKDPGFIRLWRTEKQGLNRKVVWGHNRASAH